MNSMKHPRAARCRRLVGARYGFTLIELLAVMAIILILAGLILSIAGNANFRGAEARAQGEIQAISAACESYKTDNGAYPETPTGSPGTDTLSPMTDTDPASGTSSAKYYAAGETLYQALAGVNSSGGNTDANGNLLKVYMNFTPGQLYSSSSSAVNPCSTPPVSTGVLPTIYVADPFGLPYGYSTEQATANQTAAANSTTPATVGYNPTFDLWSTAGYSPTSGKSYPSNIAAANYYTLWIRNW